MKSLKLLALAGFASLLWTSCQNANARTECIDLVTGDTVYIEKSETGQMVNAETKQPVPLYVNLKNEDTIMGSTGEVVNNRLRSTEDAYYVFADNREYKFKVEGDGDYKEKIGDDYKVKYDDGEYKIKHGNYKKEVEKDGDVKIKDGNVKIKIDGETGERKVKIDD